MKAMQPELLKGLSEEQIAKVKACKNQEELLALAKQEGIELNDEQLEAVNGGCGTSTATKIKIGGGVCPYCHRAFRFLQTFWEGGKYYYYCSKCDKRFDDLYRG